jgi:AcrR family transcriptional regulator
MEICPLNPKGVRMECKENNKTKILLLKTAESLFANFGYGGTTIRAIAEKSGINSAMINYYFGSKESLYHSIFESHLGDMVKTIETIEGNTKNPEDRLKVFLQYYCGRIQTNQDYYRILFSQLFGTQNAEIMKIVSTLRITIFNFLERTTVQGSQQGLFRAVDAEMFAMNMMTLLPALNSSNKGFLNLSEEVNSDLAKRVIAYFLSSLIPLKYN